MSKKNFPTMVNAELESALPRHARNKVKQYKQNIYPVLLQFGLLDDAHVQKYLNCGTMEEIYKDLPEVKQYHENYVSLWNLKTR